MTKKDCIIKELKARGFVVEAGKSQIEIEVYIPAPSEESNFHVCTVNITAKTVVFKQQKETSLSWCVHAHLTDVLEASRCY